MRVLVTGGTGFLGKNLLEYFEENWDNFLQEHPDSEIFFAGTGRNKEFDLTVAEKAHFLFKTYYPIDVVIHAAGNVGGIRKNQKSPAILAKDNVLMGVNVIEAACKNHVDKVYLIGTTCSYKSDCPTPFKENDLFAGLGEVTNRGYGEAKKFLFVLHDMYRTQFKIKGAKLIPANLFGIYDLFDLENSHVVPALIRKFVEAKKNNSKIVECWGSGQVSREFLNAKDCARAIYLAVKNELDTESPINIGTGEEILIKDLAYLIAEIVGFEGEIVFTGEVSDGQRKRCLDVSRAKEFLGFEAQIKLKDGLRETIQWYMENYEGNENE